MATDYASTTEVYDALPDVDTSNATQTATIARFITRASRLIDNYVNTRAGQTEAFPRNTGSKVARTFYGSGRTRLYLDHYEGTVLSSDVTMPSGYTVPTFVAQGSYLRTAMSTGVLYPDDGDYVDRDSFLSFSAPALWNRGVPITIAADWGWAANPGEIAEACVEIVTAWWRQRYAPALPSSETWRGDVGINWEIPPTAKAILDDWNRVNFVKLFTA